MAATARVSFAPSVEREEEARVEAEADAKAHAEPEAEAPAGPEPPLGGADAAAAPDPAAAEHEKVVFALVGLPARGKSFIAGKVTTLLSWVGVRAEIFNAGRRRRQSLGAEVSGRSEFFTREPGTNGASPLDRIAMEELGCALDYLQRGGSVAIFDATNTTRARREMVRDCVGSKANLIFLESVCDDPEVLCTNLKQKVRQSPDFADMDEEAALEDLRARIAQYEAVYERLEDDEGLSYIKIIDLASKLVCYRLQGRIPIEVCRLLMSCHVSPRPVYICRAGQDTTLENLGNAQQAAVAAHLTERGRQAAGGGAGASTARTPRCGAARGPYRKFTFEISPNGREEVPEMAMMSTTISNASLSDHGRQFARRLGKFLELQGHSRVRTFTSTLRRASETAEVALPSEARRIQHRSSLGLLNTGICHGMSVAEIQEEMPEEVEKWKRGPFRYRFPGGESLLDKNMKLLDVMIEIERERDPVLVVSHLSTSQSLLAYFLASPMDRAPLLSVPHHGVLVLTPSNYGWSVRTVTEGELPEVD